MPVKKIATVSTHQLRLLCQKVLENLSKEVESLNKRRDTSLHFCQKESCITITTPNTLGMEF